MRKKRLGDLLVDSNLITEEQLSIALEHKSPNEKLGDTFLREGYITEQQLIEVLEFQLGIPHINIYQYPIDLKAVHLVPREMAKRHQVMPIRIDDNQLVIAMSDPMDYFAIEELRLVTGYQIVPAIATTESVQQTINKYYDIEETLDEAMESFLPNESVEESEITDEDSPIVRLVNQIITSAVALRASDIHFDPQEMDFRIRYRIDGQLRTQRTLPKNMQKVITARLKIMANLNITDNRKPQDGRIKMHVNYKPIDMRVSTLPSIYGEIVVMRILDLSQALTGLDSIGFTKDNEEQFRTMINRPNGIVLMTGPTGSGKSTTLYAALNQLNNDHVNIITVEDPVEYQLAGVNQVQVNEQIGMTFATGLRSILRQDPDIIMVGEIRDFETAQISVRASLTGHLVLSTLHTNSAVAALTRLIDMGVERFLLASSLSGAVAQRLVRRVCRDCEEVVAVSEHEKEIFNRAHINIETVKKGKGCPTCHDTGYRGRIAIQEVLPIDSSIRELIMGAHSAEEIRTYVKDKGMKFLLDDGLQKVQKGLTTTEEVLRVATLD